MTENYANLNIARGATLNFGLSLADEFWFCLIKSPAIKRYSWLYCSRNRKLISVVSYVFLVLTRARPAQWHWHFGSPGIRHTSKRWLNLNGRRWIIGKLNVIYSTGNCSITNGIISPFPTKTPTQEGLGIGN
jgi:hypothetical protein